MKIRKIVAYVMTLCIILAGFISENMLPNFFVTANASANIYTTKTYEDITNMESKIDSDVDISEADTIAIIGGSDGPTAIFLTDRLNTKNFGSLAIAALSFISLIIANQFFTSNNIHTVR